MDSRYPEYITVRVVAVLRHLLPQERLHQLSYRRAHKPKKLSGYFWIGSPVVVYCTNCGWPAYVLPASRTETIKLCAECNELQEMGLIPQERPASQPAGAAIRQAGDPINYANPRIVPLGEDSPVTEESVHDESTPEGPGRMPRPYESPAG